MLNVGAWPSRRPRRLQSTEAPAHHLQSLSPGAHLPSLCLSVPSPGRTGVACHTAAPSTLATSYLVAAQQVCCRGLALGCPTVTGSVSEPEGGPWHAHPTLEPWGRFILSPGCSITYLEHLLPSALCSTLSDLAASGLAAVVQHHCWRLVGRPGCSSWPGSPPEIPAESVPVTTPAPHQSQPDGRACKLSLQSTACTRRWILGYQNPLSLKQFLVPTNLSWLPYHPSVLVKGKIPLYSTLGPLHLLRQTDSLATTVVVGLLGALRLTDPQDSQASDPWPGSVGSQQTDAGPWAAEGAASLGP
ncbi:hypothetical protein NDU88_006094 [Pleurodeles waltl]|uniref:Uncharacterized protein n=1 Tax=Pleurodeles waltl TaxID=8319 RepID=A0AAV7N222_PLEWA|nr:hypothetical protein NDU88_006094 [Pleurodeles waltl]